MFSSKFILFHNYAYSCILNSSALFKAVRIGMLAAALSCMAQPIPLVDPRGIPKDHPLTMKEAWHIRRGDMVYLACMLYLANRWALRLLTWPLPYSAALCRAEALSCNQTINLTVVSSILPSSSLRFPSRSFFFFLSFYSPAGKRKKITVAVLFIKYPLS